MKAKKVLAMLMASAMIMGTTVTAFAADIPKETDKEEARVQNVVKDATVTAYQIVDAVYNENGFVKYDVVKNTEGQALVNIADPEKPLSTEVAQIAKDINSSEADDPDSLANTLLSMPMYYEDTSEDGVDNGEYVADLPAGYWLVLVRTTGTTIYNPMLIGVYYSESGSDNTLISGPVDASSDWKLVTDEAWAKSSEIPFEKEADKETADIGETVGYTITTEVPEYGPEYETVVFNVSDTLSGLALTGNSIQVSCSDEDVSMENAYQISYTGTTDEETGEGATAFTVRFSSEWILENGGKGITISYSAIMTGEGVNDEAHTNNAELTYTNNPGTHTGGQKDIEKVYTFDIDGEVTGDILKKVKPGETNEETVALQDAQFTLYTEYDEEKKDVVSDSIYTNATNTTGISTSDANGKIYYTGLAAGTYYLKETQAPEGYTLNNTVYKIDIDATIEDEELKSWTIKVTDMATNKDVTNDFTVENETVSKGEDNTTTEIMNTTISQLPSTGGMGTTIFTIGGCVIMVTAAGLYFATRKKEQK